MQELYDAVRYDRPEHIVELLHRALESDDHRAFAGAVREAVFHGRRRILAAYLDAGFSADLRDDQRQTPLMWAAARGQLSPLQDLLDHGANINATDSAGWTPLMHAIIGQQVATGRALLDAGADASPRDAEGRTAADLARLKVVSYRLPFGGQLSGWSYRLFGRSPVLKELLRARRDK